MSNFCRVNRDSLVKQAEKMIDSSQIFRKYISVMLFNNCTLESYSKEKVEKKLKSNFKYDVLDMMLCKYEKLKELLDAFIELDQQESFDDFDNNRCKLDELNEFCEHVLNNFKEEILGE